VPYTARLVTTNTSPKRFFFFYAKVMQLQEIHNSNSTSVSMAITIQVTLEGLGKSAFTSGSGKEFCVEITFGTKKH